MDENRTASDDQDREYGYSRSSFLRLVAERSDARLETYRHPERGPDGEPLFVDTAYIGRGDEKEVIVLISGTHGVEGIAGSFIQRSWLGSGRIDHRPHGVGVLLIHAINPWGFAWRRRTTHENIDLNRNWIDFAAPLPPNHAYDDLAHVLAPVRRGDARPLVLMRRVFAYVLRRGGYGLALGRGMRRLQAAVSIGQYSHPDGIFFGGHAPSWSRGIWTRILQDELRQARHVAVVDLHTGLGRNGAAERMVSAEAGSPDALRAREVFGEAVIPVGGSGSASAPIMGEWMSGASDLLPHADVTAITLEFGTRPALTVLQALVQDNWLHMHGDPRGPDGARIKRSITDAFFDGSDEWRTLVTTATFDCVETAMIRLVATAGPRGSNDRDGTTDA